MFSLTGPPLPAGWRPQSKQQRSILKCRTQKLRWRRYARKDGAGETGGAQNVSASPPPLLQQPLSLPPDDPTLQSFAAAYGADPLSPPPVIAAIARAAAAERAAAAAADDGATRWAGAGELYQLRLGTAVALQGILGGGALSLGRRPPPPRDRAIKVVASVCDDVTGAILESREFAALQETLIHAAAAVAADSSSSSSSSSTAFDAWAASMTTVYVPCLGSIEARRSYLEEYAQRRLQAFRGADGEPFDVDITRGWAAARALWQFALARALAGLLGSGGPGAAGGGGAQVLVSDPALTAFDRRVLSACGAQVLPPGSHPIGDDDGGVLVFAPNCPHGVNAEILRASGEAGGLHALAYIGTCCEYYDELEGLRERQQQQQQQQQQTAAAAAPPPFVEDDGGGSCCGCGSGGSGGGDGENALGWLASLRRDGRAVELALPSFGLLCDPATRLHVFPRGRGAAE
jgi:hypothetical protein